MPILCFPRPRALPAQSRCNNPSLRSWSVLSLTVLLCVAIAITLLWSDQASAKAVISEVSWVGSDLSTADEWLEVGDSGTGSGTGTELGGWTLTSVNSSGVENVIFTFPATVHVSPGQYLVISHFASAQSRLLADPAFISSSISLPNTKLLLRLRDTAGQVIDQADDGVGDPMAGENISSPVRKSTMERIDLAKSGSDASNWVTATDTVGWDDGVTVMRGTPGFPHATALPSMQSSSSSPSLSSSSSSFSSSSSSSSSVPPASSASSVPFQVSSSSSISSSLVSTSTSCPAWDPFISLQSGSTTGEEKVTLNIQILQRFGSLGSAACSVDFGDGTISPSCNPASHTFDHPGSFTIRAEVRSSCGETAIRTMAVEVSPKAGTSSSVSASLPPGASDSPSGGEDLMTDRWPVGAGPPFILSAVLPNPDGKDTGKEWIEIASMTSQSANLNGWSIRIPHGKNSKYVFGDVGFSLRESKRFLASEFGMTLGNDAGDISLLDPSGQIVSTLSWSNARDGAIIRPQRSFSGTVRARVTHVIDGDTMDVDIANAAGELGRTERVRFIGIDAPELHASDPVQRMLAKRAMEFLRARVEGATVTLTPGTDARDMYGRLLAYVATEDGDSVQEMLLREGLASAYLRYAFAKESEFIGYQREAQEAGAGMWGVGGSSLMTGDESGKWKVENGKLGAEVFGSADKNASAAISSPLFFHLSSSSESSSAKSVKAKKSSSSKSPAKRKVSAVKIPATKKKSTASASSSSGPEENMSPLFRSGQSGGPSPSDELLALDDLIEEPEPAFGGMIQGAQAQGEVRDALSEAVSDDSRGSLWIFFTIALGVAAGVSGGAGWWVARRSL